MADKALLLGINSYKSVSGLRGCENDVLGMRSLLTEVFNFNTTNIKILLHSDVTKARIKPLLRWLYQDTKEGDRLVLHFSGHGSYRDDLSGDEKDKVDELICLYDMDFDNKDSYFLDDELRDWTQKLPKGRQLLVVLDNCHSGTGTRKIIPPETTKHRTEFPAIIDRPTEHRRAARGLARSLTAEDDPHDPTTVIARFVEPPTEILQKLGGAKPRRMVRREVTSALNHVLLAACRDNQTAADAFIDGHFHGAFTFNLCKVLRGAGGISMSFREILDRLTMVLEAGQFDQVPQFEGPSDQGPLFAPRKSEDPESLIPQDFSPPVVASTSPAPPDGGPLSDGDGTNPAYAPPSGPASPPDSELPRRMEEFLAAYNRVLVAGGATANGLGWGPTGVGTWAARAAVGRKAVVYVHGICEHSTGFSDAWWAALSPFAADLQPGDLGDPGTTTARRYEVIWSDLVRGGSRDLAAVSPARALQAEETRQRIVEILEDRARQQASAMVVAGPPAVGPERPLEVVGTDRALFGIPGLDCIHDFVRYLEDESTRKQVIGRFVRVVSPLLRAGVQVEVISHSWGTVVAYEALCQLESVTPQASGSVANFFTVGSALSIGYVKNRLNPDSRDGHRPRMVGNWVNLDARGDIVGGSLRDLPFAIDHEFLNLEPVGCSLVLPSPACAHSSYFDRRNIATNRDIFGRIIGS